LLADARDGNHGEMSAGVQIWLALHDRSQNKASRGAQSAATIFPHIGLWLATRFASALGNIVVVVAARNRLLAAKQRGS
jgi:hypothetical protein